MVPVGATASQAFTFLAPTNYPALMANCPMGDANQNNCNQYIPGPNPNHAAWCVNLNNYLIEETGPCLTGTTWSTNFGGVGSIPLTANTADPQPTYIFDLPDQSGTTSDLVKTPTTPNHIKFRVISEITGAPMLHCSAVFTLTIFCANNYPITEVVAPVNPLIIAHGSVSTSTDDIGFILPDYQTWLIDGTTLNPGCPVRSASTTPSSTAANTDRSVQNIVV